MEKISRGELSLTEATQIFSPCYLRSFFITIPLHIVFNFTDICLSVIKSHSKSSITEYLMLYQHESAHESICKLFHGNGYDTQIHLLSESNSTCEVKNTPEYSIAQSEVEAFGYQLLGFIDSLIVIISGVGIFIIWCCNDRNHR